MFLFILETIGTPELILIAIVALIVLGPRKLPQMAKTVAKTVGEFKNATNEFKSTWEKEVAFEDESNRQVKTHARSEITTDVNSMNNNSTEIATDRTLLQPEVKELTSEDVAQKLKGTEPAAFELQPAGNKNELSTADKHNWL